MRSITLILSSLLGLVGCGENFEVLVGTGMKGTVYSGSGGCDSLLPEANRHYEPYNGFLYLLDKSDYDDHIELNQAHDADSISDAIFSHMKGHSFSTWVGYGKLDTEVPKGIYYLATRDVMGRSGQHVISIEEGTNLTVDVRFWECIES